jgi:hypothetical protein
MREMSAMKCNDIREMLALDQAIADADVQAHINACAGCALLPVMRIIAAIASASVKSPSGLMSPRCGDCCA